jgi:hypothetical protein
MSQRPDEGGVDPGRQTAVDVAEAEEGRAVLFEQLRREFLDQRGIDPTPHIAYESPQRLGLSRPEDNPSSH